jgi:class 3 adenylate cyclase
MLSCPSCGAEVPGGFAFCGQCGAPLVPGPGMEERRVVTVLFCDLVGFTARADRADPEDVRALLRPYHARLRREVERFGGTLDKFIGDGAMAVFGVPSTHEDDPERAVRCGLAILESVRDLNRAQPHLDLNVRVGVNTGEVVVAVDRRHGEGVVGDVVNTASRLEGVAPVGGVLVGEATFRATRGLFDYEPLPPVRVKGEAEALAVWRAASTRSRLGVAVDQTPATPFLGRRGELDRLRRSYARARDEGSVQLVTITGEPGVGKSRLVWELRAFVDAQPELVAWRQGHCLPYGEGISFWALGEVLKAQAGILEFDDPGGGRGQAGRGGRGRGRGAGRAPVARDPPGPPAGPGRGGRGQVGHGRAGGELHRLAPLPGGGGRPAAAGAGARGPALGRRRPARLRPGAAGADRAGGP